MTSTNADTAALLPCPHCGGKAAFMPRAVNIVLQKDPSEPKFGVSVVYEAHAARAWNRRPAAQPAGDDPEHWAELRALGWYRRDCKVCGESMSALCEPAEISAPPVAEPPARTFSDFISNATPEEKTERYTGVMERAAERQRETLGEEPLPPMPPIMEIASEWFVTGENQLRADDYYYRSLGATSNVRRSDLIEFARAVVLADRRQRAAPAVAHIYAGDCPDEHQPDARDPNCPACSVEWRAAGQDEAMEVLLELVAAETACTEAMEAPTAPNELLQILGRLSNAWARARTLTGEKS